ncbi:Pfs, NB-ARC and Ankyrin domain protein [Trichophyton benhamiae CBS 112371]|uniref:Pfs, NB-ARC and Ankyrin domain protein n=1 Tax=Arthroderma benhamiae (strain ATCC MYA-4681 / CBS 112371) TaxID=663331 RepID=D4AXZ7_ARTBC|nr:Pfs, NB-ARC and Ankyrin domain protein [Trichophyton benhamiae CBS 112371]EFE32175.1 Pfs, NB-ARC and Ankyrin domain protein [Trichophyton benhamiae CBS 112371]
MSVLSNGISILYTPEKTDPFADIVFVHGFQGHARKTWTARAPKTTKFRGRQQKAAVLDRPTVRDSQHQLTPDDGQPEDSKTDIFWPLDLLPEECPDCRIMTFGEVDISFLWPTRLEVLRLAARDEDASVLDIRDSTKAVFFLGTPHHGSGLATSGEMMRKMVAFSMFNTNAYILRALHYGSHESKVAHDDFMRQWHQERFLVRTFQESLALGIFPGVSGKIVPDISSSLGDPRENAQYINANHRDMCRFTGKDDPGYQQVGSELRRVTNKLRLEYKISQDKAQDIKSEHIEELSSEELGMGPLQWYPSLCTNTEIECLRSLSVPEADMWDYNVDQEVQATCTWLFDKEEYCSWKDTSNLDMKNSLLRVKGKLGTGKSTSVRVAMSRLWSEQSTCPGIKLAFFFDNLTNTPGNPQLRLFKSLLFQLFQQSKQIFLRFMPVFRRKKGLHNNHWAWSEDELKSFFLSVMKDLPVSSAFIFIDALHECEEARDVITFFESVRTSSIEKNIPLKICYSSRHYPPIDVGDYAELIIDAHNNYDIENYIQRKLKPLLKRRYIDRLMDRIAEKAQGVFLWVVLVVGKVIKAHDQGESMERMQEIVENVPDKLESLYREALKSALLNRPGETLSIFQWVLCASRLLSLTELRYSLIFQKNGYKSQAEAESCSSFIECDEQMDILHRVRTGGLTDTSTRKAINTAYARQIFDADNQTTIHLVHDSVRDFLLNHGGLKLLDSGSADDLFRQGHKRLAEACINYLNIAELQHIAKARPEPDVLGLTKSIELFQQLCRQFPFLHYSLNSVFKHIEAAELCSKDDNGPPSYLYHRMEDTFFVWRYLSDLESKCRFNEVQGKEATLAHLAAEYGLISWVKYYISSGGDIHREGGRFGTLLQAAAGMGHEEVFDLLLSHGADVNYLSGMLGSPLVAAASESHLSIVKTLIERGANVNEECGPYGCALQAAVRSPRDSSKLVQMLLDAGADIHMQHGIYGTPLQAAAYKGREEIVRTLLARGAQVNIVSGKYGTALGAAAFQGHDQIVQIFLEHGADTTTEAGDYGNSTWAAAYNGKESVLQQLLRNRYPSWQDDILESKVRGMMNQAIRTVAFHEAVEDGDFDSVKKSLEDGIDPNARGGVDSSALHSAAFYQHAEIVALLLAQKDIIVDVRDYDGRSPLWIAASDGNIEITKMLLNTGQVDVRQKPASGRNLLWYAAKDGRIDMIRLMLEAGVDPFEVDDDGVSPIMRAEKEGRKEVVSLFQTDGGKK